MERDGSASREQKSWLDKHSQSWAGIAGHSLGNPVEIRQGSRRSAIMTWVCSGCLGARGTGTEATRLHRVVEEEHAFAEEIIPECVTLQAVGSCL